MDVNVNFLTVKSEFEAETIRSSHASISTATTTNIDVSIPQGGDLMSLAVAFSAYVAADYITSIKIMNSAGTVTKHIITGGQLHVPMSQNLNLCGENPLFKGCLAGDIVRISYVSTTTTAQIIDAYAEVAQNVQTS